MQTRFAEQTVQAISARRPQNNNFVCEYFIVHIQSFPIIKTCAISYYNILANVLFSANFMLASSICAILCFVTFSKMF